MSGDVQPRKRKDKKKRKDEDVYSSVPSNEDVNIHVHKDGGTGGNICAKIVFFFLFSALIVLIGLIIKENQGLNELENIEEESRFSQIFEGWVDKTPEEHEDHSPELHDEGDDHDVDEDLEDHESEESNLEEDTEEDQSQEEEEDEEESAVKSEEDEPTEESEEIYQSQEEDEQDIDEKSDDTEEAEDEDDDNDEASNESKELKKSRDIDDEEEEELTKDISEEAKADGATKEEAKEGKDETVTEQPESVPQSSKEQHSGLATKIGVGVALLTVAYNVFLRKRRSDSPEKQTKTIPAEEKEVTPDLSRRNTIVPPPSLQEVEQDLPEVELEDEEYSEEEYSDEDSRSEHRSAREEYQELRTTYARSLTPEGEFDVKDKFLEAEILEDEIEEEEEEEEEDFEPEEELEEDDIDDDYGKYDEDEDEELLKRLEAKYGKLGRDVNVGDTPESDSDRDDYEHSDITNKEDYAIKEEVDAAQQQLNKNAAYANKMFEALLDKYPLSPRSLYGKAKALDILAEKRQSNDLLKQSLNYYLKALNAPNTPDQLFLLVADRYIDRARFMGQYKKAIDAHGQVIERFPQNATYLNNLAVTYLTINLIEEARATLKRVLSRWPNDGFALVHYGFILKTADNNLEESVEYMSKGLKTRAPGVIDGRFYFHLGDALTRLNRKEEAIKIYEDGVKEKVFRSKYQRSLYNVDRLTAKPWWEPTDIPPYQKLFSALKESWKKIRQEGLSALNDQGYFKDEAENLRDTGTWKQLELFARGHEFSKNCARSPITCNIIRKFPDASGCRRGQTKFSVMHPGTHVWPHCGPTNCRLRIHLGLKVPPKTFIRVAEETRSWQEGDIIIFDDSFEHEVWHNGSEFRLVLIIDVWHPDLTLAEKNTLSSI